MGVVTFGGKWRADKEGLESEELLLANMETRGNTSLLPFLLLCARLHQIVQGFHGYVGSVPLVGGICVWLGIATLVVEFEKGASLICSPLIMPLMMGISGKL